ncbi:MAG: VPLPA-CTERM sorting domain-containing protein [Roseobacter sp.]
MYQYFAGAAVAAMMASTAVATTSAPSYFGNGFNYQANVMNNGSMFGPAAVFETVTFDRDGKDFFFISVDVNNTNYEAAGTVSFVGYSSNENLGPSTIEYEGGDTVDKAPEGLVFKTVLSGEETTAIKALSITFGNYNPEPDEYVAARSVCVTQFDESYEDSCSQGPSVGVTIKNVELSAVPLPASVLLLGAGIAGLGAMRRRQKKA